MLTPGQAHDLTCAEALIENANPDALIADKAYDADPFVDTLSEREITPVIPPKTNRKIERESIAPSFPNCKFFTGRRLDEYREKVQSLQANSGLYAVRS